MWQPLWSQIDTTVTVTTVFHCHSTLVYTGYHCTTSSHYRIYHTVHIVPRDCTSVIPFCKPSFTRYYNWVLYCMIQFKIHTCQGLWWTICQKLQGYYTIIFCWLYLCFTTLKSWLFHVHSGSWHVRLLVCICVLSKLFWNSYYGFVKQIILGKYRQF